MSPEVYAVGERLHGLAATVGLAALLHPVLARRGGLGSATAGAAILVGAWFAGAWVYVPFGHEVRATLPPAWHAVFEAKEHLAALSAASAAAGALILRCQPRTGTSGPGWHLLAVSVLCGTFAGVVGILTAGLAAR